MKALIVYCLLLFIHMGIAPPPRRPEHEANGGKVKAEEEPSGLEGLGIEYERYLREVIDVLESDPQFKQKLEAAEEADIRSGKIAHELEYVDHNVRSKLDEVKRAELERLRHLAQREFELSNGIDTDHMKIIPPEHLDHDNPHTFEINDLKKLIHKVTNDLNEADKKRREEFKEYEMQKEFENQEKLKHLEGAEKEAFEKQLKDNETKHKQHEPLHHPGSKAQLEEVWEKQDHMKDQEFNPKVFFQLHDVDGNGYWDQNEVKALFVKELDKMYQAGAPEDDMRERAEELERMREHVYKEADENGDQLISYQEFLKQTRQPEFQKDPHWETIDQQQPVYTHEEYLEFERRRQQEIQRMIQQGLIPPQPVYHVPPGYHPQVQQQFHDAAQHQQYPQYQAHPAQYQQGQQMHPGQFQQVHPGQNQQGQQTHPNQFQQVHPGQNQQGQQAHPGQFQQVHPAQNQHPGVQQQQLHNAQYQQIQPGVQQAHPGQQQQGQFHQGQPVVQQPHPGQHNQVPPGQLRQSQQHPEQFQHQPDVRSEQIQVSHNQGQFQQAAYQQQIPQQPGTFGLNEQQPAHVASDPNAIHPIPPLPSSPPPPVRQFGSIQDQTGNQPSPQRTQASSDSLAQQQHRDNIARGQMNQHNQHPNSIGAAQKA